ARAVAQSVGERAGIDFSRAQHEPALAVRSAGDEETLVAVARSVDSHAFAFEDSGLPRALKNLARANLEPTPAVRAAVPDLARIDAEDCPGIIACRSAIAPDEPALARHDAVLADAAARLAFFRLPD